MSSILNVLTEQGNQLLAANKSLTDPEVVTWENKVVEVISFIYGQYDANGQSTAQYQAFLAAKDIEAKLGVINSLQL